MHDRSGYENSGVVLPRESKRAVGAWTYKDLITEGSQEWGD